MRIFMILIGMVFSTYSFGQCAKTINVLNSVIPLPGWFSEIKESEASWDPFNPYFCKYIGFGADTSMVVPDGGLSEKCTISGRVITCPFNGQIQKIICPEIVKMKSYLDNLENDDSEIIGRGKFISARLEYLTSPIISAWFFYCKYRPVTNLLKL